MMTRVGGRDPVWKVTFRNRDVYMFPFPTGEIKRPFVDLKVFGRGADLSTDSRQVAGEVGVDWLRHVWSFV